MPLRAGDGGPGVRGVAASKVERECLHVHLQYSIVYLQHNIANNFRISDVSLVAKAEIAMMFLLSSEGGEQMCKERAISYPTDFLPNQQMCERGRFPTEQCPAW